MIGTTQRSPGTGASARDAGRPERPGAAPAARLEAAAAARGVALRNRVAGISHRATGATFIGRRTAAVASTLPSYAALRAYGPIVVSMSMGCLCCR